eukprot:CAMPEP_0116553988 /NCGR_PEP_ID=MMETSP0397-20121206/7342_1 /TAXON_ID=216820 /ORGANISM="Cyclophora tenuis, Strain ECT3854" /LENGTH=453 /DNA_ID=CAMNT_0004079099 /DNA_START=226 /DNA_END=1587 /DNA_ORIENTATION=+
MSIAEEILVASVTFFGATLSMLGSFFIISNIMRRKKYKRGSYHRLLLGLSFCDSVSSVGWFIAPMAPPKDTSPRLLSIGTTASCTANGVLLQFGIGFSLYNACLSIFYWLTICYNIRKRDMIWRESLMHLCSLGFAMGSAMAPIPLNMYNELTVGVGCWLLDFPENCHRNPNVDCIRGGSNRIITPFLGYLLAGLPGLVCFVIVAACNAVIYRASRQLNQRMRRYSITSVGTDRHQQDQQAKRTALIASQAMCYVLVFLNSFLWQVLVKVLSDFNVIRRDNETSWTALILLAQLFSSSAGFGFLLTYIRPRYLRFRDRNFSRAQAILFALTSSKEQRLSRAQSVNAGSDSSDSLDLSKDAHRRPLSVGRQSNRRSKQDVIGVPRRGLECCRWLSAIHASNDNVVLVVSLLPKILCGLKRDIQDASLRTIRQRVIMIKTSSRNFFAILHVEGKV